MAPLRIELAASQETFVAAQVKRRRLDSPGAYISHLILMEQLKAKRKQLDALLLEVCQGADTPLTEQDWREIEREGLAALAEERKHARKRAKKQQRSKRPA